MIGPRCDMDSQQLLPGGVAILFAWGHPSTNILKQGQLLFLMGCVLSRLPRLWGRTGMGSVGVKRVLSIIARTHSEYGNTFHRSLSFSLGQVCVD